MRHAALFLSLLALAPAVQAGPPTPPQPPAPPRQPVRVEVKQGDGNESMVFVRSGGGDSHALKLQSQDGKVVVEAEPNPDRPWLGVLLDDSKMMGDDERSLEVLSVADGSPAARGGLRRGDVITGINGKTLTERGDSGLLGGLRPGDRVKLQVMRDGRPVDVSIGLESRPARVEFEDTKGMNAFALAGDSFEGLAGLEALESLKGLSAIPCPEGSKCPTNGFMFRVGSPPRLGVVVEKMSEQLAKFFGAEPGKGVLVKDVVAGSAAEKAGIEAGDVILRIGDTDIEDVGDINDAIDAMSSPGDVDVEVLRRGSERTLRANITDVSRRGALAPQPFAMPHAFSMPQQIELEHLVKAVAEAHARANEGASAEALAEAAESLDRARAELERSQAELERSREDGSAAALARAAAELDRARAEHERRIAEEERELEAVRERSERQQDEKSHGATPSRTGRTRGSRDNMPTHGAFQRAPSATSKPGSGVFVAQ